MEGKGNHTELGGKIVAKLPWHSSKETPPASGPPYEGGKANLLNDTDGDRKCHAENAPPPFPTTHPPCCVQDGTSCAHLGAGRRGGGTLPAPSCRCCILGLFLRDSGGQGCVKLTQNSATFERQSVTIPPFTNHCLGNASQRKQSNQTTGKLHILRKRGEIVISLGMVLGQQLERKKEDYTVSCR